MALFTPTNQKPLTNISVVRLKKNGTRFELACYPNKVNAWRDKIEKDINQVLQLDQIFFNVSKGAVANKASIKEAFPDMREEEIVKNILQYGEIQVTEKERKKDADAIYRDVAQLVSEKCVNPDTNNQYSVNMIEKMMKTCHVNLKPNKNAKQLALETMKILCDNPNFRITPALIDVYVTINYGVDKEIMEIIKYYFNSIKNEGVLDNKKTFISAMIDPTNYSKLETFLQQKIKGRYSLEVQEKSKTNHETLNPHPSLAASEKKQQSEKEYDEEAKEKNKRKGRRKKRQGSFESDNE